MADNSLFENIANTSSENQILESTNEKNKSEGTDNIKFLDNEKDIVYKAYNKPYPVININSKEVKDINTKIKQDYGEEYESYIRNIKYDYYVNNEILSLVITELGIYGANYYSVYNIDISSGKEVSNTGLLKSKYIDDETVLLKKLPELYKNKFLDLYRRDEGRYIIRRTI